MLAQSIPLCIFIRSVVGTFTSKFVPYPLMLGEKQNQNPAVELRQNNNENLDVPNVQPENQ